MQVGCYGFLNGFIANGCADCGRRDLAWALAALTMACARSFNQWNRKLDCTTAHEQPLLSRFRGSNLLEVMN